MKTNDNIKLKVSTNHKIVQSLHMVPPKGKNHFQVALTLVSDLLVTFMLNVFVEKLGCVNSLAICGGNLLWTQAFLQTVSCQRFSLEIQSIVKN